MPTPSKTSRQYKLFRLTLISVVVYVSYGSDALSEVGIEGIVAAEDSFLLHHPLKKKRTWGHLKGCQQDKKISQFSICSSFFLYNTLLLLYTNNSTANQTFSLKSFCTRTNKNV